MAKEAELALQKLLPLEANSLLLTDARAHDFLFVTGLSGPEKMGRWTNGPSATMAFKLPCTKGHHVLLTLEFGAFTKPGTLDQQIVLVTANGIQVEEWTVPDGFARKRSIVLEAGTLKKDRLVSLELSLPRCASPAELNVGPDRRRLGIQISRLTWQELKELPGPSDWIRQLGRPVGGEARKSFDEHALSGFWSRFITGPNVLDIGFKGYADVTGVVPITPTAIGMDLDYPGYDGTTLPFPDESQDAVYSSHCLEHIPDYKTTIQEWHRVTKIGGHIITVVPHAYLYERGHSPPSIWNGDHKRFYTPSSLLLEFEQSLVPNSYRVRYLDDNDRNYKYENPPHTHPFGCYEIVLVIQKIAPPSWSLRS